MHEISFWFYSFSQSTYSFNISFIADFRSRFTINSDQSFLQTSFRFIIRFSFFRTFWFFRSFWSRTSFFRTLGSLRARAWRIRFWTFWWRIDDQIRGIVNEIVSCFVGRFFGFRNLFLQKYFQMRVQLLHWLQFNLQLLDFQFLLQIFFSKKHASSIISLKGPVRDLPTEGLTSWQN